MPLKITERPAISFPVVKPRDLTSRNSPSATGPDKRQYLNKIQKQNAPPIEGHARYKAPSDPLHHQASQEKRPEPKSYADHFFQIRRGTNNTSVSPHYHHKQSIDPSQYFR